MDSLRDGWLDSWLNARIERRMDGWMDEWVGGWLMVELWIAERGKVVAVGRAGRKGETEIRRQEILRGRKDEKERIEGTV